MATLSASTAASLLVGLMAIAPRPRGNGVAAPERPGCALDHGRQDAPRRVVPPLAAPRINRA